MRQPSQKGMASDEEYIEELKQRGVPKGYSRYAVDYLESAGIDPRAVDIEAEYDSTLTDTENTKEFARKFPVGKTKRYTKGEVEYTEDRAQEYAEKAYFEERRKGGYEPNQKQLPGSQLNDPYRWKRRKKGEQGFDDSDMPSEQKGAPSFIDSIMGRYNEVRAGYQARAEAQKKERVYKATEKARQLEADLQVKRAEARVRSMEKQKRFYDRAESQARFAPLVAVRDSVRGFGNRFAGRTIGDERRQAYAPSTAQRLLFGNGGGGGLGGRFGGGGESQAMRMLMGQPAQQKRRHQYVTIVKNGRVVQVDLNNPAVTGQGYGQYGQPMQQEPSLLERLSVGGGSDTRSRMMAAETRHERSLIGRLAGGDRNRPNKLASLLFGGK